MVYMSEHSFDHYQFVRVVDGCKQPNTARGDIAVFFCLLDACSFKPSQEQKSPAAVLDIFYRRVVRILDRAASLCGISQLLAG